MTWLQRILQFFSLDRQFSFQTARGQTRWHGRVGKTSGSESTDETNLCAKNKIKSMDGNERTQTLKKKWLPWYFYFLIAVTEVEGNIEIVVCCNRKTWKKVTLKLKRTTAPKYNYIAKSMLYIPHRTNCNCDKINEAASGLNLTWT